MTRIGIHRLAFVLLLPALVLAQATNATVSGTVLDPQSAVVPNTLVAAENIATGVIVTTISNAAGIYLFPSLPPGVYRLTAEAPGFRRHVLTDVTLDVGARININFPLQIATGGEQVDVTAEAGALFTGTASVGAIISGREIQELPLPNRNALGLLETQAGVVGDNISGSRIGALNITVDGINVMDQSINSGANSVIFTGIDNVEEVLVVTSPVDAEYGRGSAQVQISTKSGSNDIRGSVYEYHSNTALNSNNWFDNLRGQPRDSYIEHHFGGRIGGPIIRQRTFFHFNYDGRRFREGISITELAYTDTARQGIFRFYPGVQNGNANAQTPTVDLAGNPVRPASATGDLQSVSLFGRDPLRPSYDPTGTVQRLLGLTPLPNDFRFGDGLNVAAHTWRLRQLLDFNQYNTKIDHTQGRHSLSFTYTREDVDVQNGYMAQTFPGSPGGSVDEVVDFFVANVTSTFSPTAFNEFHAGFQRPKVRFHAPWESPAGKAAMSTIDGNEYLPVFSLVADPIFAAGDPQGRISPLYTYRDTFHVNSGRHAVKFGGELRYASTNGFDASGTMPRVVFGLGFGPGVVGVDSASIPGLGANEAFAELMLTDLTGSVDGVYQSFNATFGPNPGFHPGVARQRTWRQRELSLFIQDDFKLTPNLTLNLGTRYEFYGIPWDANGRTAGLVGGSTGLFGISGTSWSDVYRPGEFNGDFTQVQLVGKNSPQPNAQLFSDDRNNFAPVFGLSWSIPYFGQDKTILRAGYSIAYPREGLVLADAVAGRQPGLRVDDSFSSSQYLNLTNISLPLRPSSEPLEVVPLTDRSSTVFAFDNNLRTSYVQNWNLSVQRTLPADFILDVRYVGSKGTKLIRAVNINEVNIFENGIAEAFRITQAGGNAPLFDRLFAGFNLGLGTVNGTTVTGSASARAFAGTRGFLANNEVGGFADYVNRVSEGILLPFAGLPENWVVANPQFGAAYYVGNFSNSSYHSMQLETRKALSSGWQLESNYTWSRTLGDEDGDSQNLVNSYRNGRDRSLDKRLLFSHRTHVLRSSGIWELPFGPNRYFLGQSRGALARIVEGWEFSAIANLFSGVPTSFYSGVTSFNQYADNTATLVGSLPKDAGEVTRTDNGIVYFPGMKQVDDPAIAGLTSLQLLNTRSVLKAIADNSGNLIAVNPLPGTVGSLSQTWIEGPGAIRFDLALQKKIQLGEGREFILRGDAINVLNTPLFFNPNTDINSPNFGRITQAGGDRRVLISGRINF